MADRSRRGGLGEGESNGDSKLNFSKEGWLSELQGRCTHPGTPGLGGQDELVLGVGICPERSQVGSRLISRSLGGGMGERELQLSSVVKLLETPGPPSSARRGPAVGK